MITDHAELFKKFPVWAYKAAAQLWIDKEFPRHIFIETTAACNLSCDYCPREKTKFHMSFELFKKIVDEASAHGPRSFSLHLFGEPLLYPYLFDAISYIKCSNRFHTVLLTTNGTLLERYREELIASGITKLIWSWRPEAKFSAETKARLKRWGKFHVRIINGVTAPQALVEWGDWPNLERRDLHNYGGEIELKKFGVQNTPAKRYPCYHLWLAPAVAWNGNLLMCCSDPHQKEVLGCFPGTSLTEMWKSLGKIRQSHLDGKYEGICKDCDVWKSYPDLFFSWQRTT